MTWLKIDKDVVIDKDWMQAYVLAIIVLCRLFHVTVDWIKVCRSRKKGFHVYIATLEMIDAVKANLLQFLLGDDCLRVDHNRARIAAGFTEWNKLFTQPGCRLRTVYTRTSRTKSKFWRQNTKKWKGGV